MIPCYQSLEVPSIATSGVIFTNNTKLFVVLLGIGLNGLAATIPVDTSLWAVQVKNPIGTVIDSAGVESNSYIADPATGVATISFWIPRRMLVPPGGTITALGFSRTLGASLSICASFEDAVVIL